MITIVLPHPPAPLRPNARCHWARKAKAVKAYRKLAQMRALEALAMRNPPMWERATVVVIWRSTTARHPDPDNIIASLKASFDGLADAGIIENDKGLWPERPIIETKARWPEVVLQIEEE
jgi:crossover junction endodeoxyribonuclease RusA